LGDGDWVGRGCKTLLWRERATLAGANRGGNIGRLKRGQGISLEGFKGFPGYSMGLRNTFLVPLEANFSKPGLISTGDWFGTFGSQGWGKMDQKETGLINLGG